MRIQTGIITVSDRAARGRYPDLGGPAVREAAIRYEWEVSALTVVPDQKQEIQHAIRNQVQSGCHLILTTGGTGVSVGDVTPEAVREMAERELPGFGEAMRAESMKLSPHAILSRCLAAVVETTLVVCLPGKPKGAVECLGVVAGAIPHCIELLQGKQGHHGPATEEPD